MPEARALVHRIPESSQGFSGRYLSLCSVGEIISLNGGIRKPSSPAAAPGPKQMRQPREELPQNQVEDELEGDAPAELHLA